MNRNLFACFVSFVVFAFSAMTFAQEASLEGTYKLVSRKLPDGTIQKSPDVVGLFTYTKTARNFNVAWKGKDGKWASLSLASTYTLKGTEYTETLLFSVMIDPSSSKDPIIAGPGETKSTTVKIDGKKITFKPPFDAPTAVIDGDSIIATLEGAFVDTWERVP